MDTVIKKIMHDDSDDEIYEQAAEILKNGGLVAFPTETVYGLGADALLMRQRRSMQRREDLLIIRLLCILLIRKI